MHLVAHAPTLDAVTGTDLSAFVTTLLCYHRQTVAAIVNTLRMFCGFYTQQLVAIRRISVVRCLTCPRPVVTNAFQAHGQKMPLPALSPRWTAAIPWVNAIMLFCCWLHVWGYALGILRH